MKRELFLTRLSRSTFYREYQRAFTDATGLSMALRPADAGNGSNRAAGMFLTMSSLYANLHADRPKAAPGLGRLIEATVPVHHGRRLLGFLQTNKFVVGPLGKQTPAHASRGSKTNNVNLDFHQKEKPPIPMRVLSVAEYDVVLGLLSTLAGQMGVCLHRFGLRARKAHS